MKKRLILALAAVVAAVSCSQKEPEGGQTAAPVLVSSYPEEGEEITLSGSSLTVKLTFDQNVKCPTDKRELISAGEATIEKIVVPGTVDITLSGLVKDHSYTLTFPEGTIANYSDVAAKAFTLSFTTAAGGSGGGGDDDVDTTEPEHGDNAAWQMADRLRIGWNMGNHMDAYYNGTWAGDKYNYPDETCWGAEPCTQETFNGVKAAGFTSVRIPITWLNMIGDAPDYTIDETWMSRVEEIVGYAENAGLNVIINTHHDENNADDHWLDILNASKDATVNAAIKDKIAGFWTNVANRFKDKGDWLVFESFNEIQDGGWGWSADFRANPAKQCNVLNDWNQVFVKAVRATGGNNSTRWLGVPTYAASPSYVDYFALPDDAAGRVMVAVHFYDPNEYTIGEAQYEQWGHTGTAGKKATWGDEDHVKETFAKLYHRFVEKGVPVYLGEFGCSMRSKSNTTAWSFYKYYIEYVSKAARTYGLPCYIWDNGSSDTGQEQHGYINHGTGKYIGNSKEIVDLMVKGQTDDSEDYTLTSVYLSAPK